MINVYTDNAGEVIALEADGTRHNPQALLAAAATAARYSAALATIGAGHPFDAPAFARDVLAGATVDEALSDDVAAMAAPLPPEEQLELDTSIRRAEARRELVRAALRWAEADAAWNELVSSVKDIGGFEYAADADKAVSEAEERLASAAEAFKAAGGNEVIG